MAGYKRQSPLKKYGRREIVKLNVDEQKKAYQSNAKAAGSVGRAVGAVGTSIGKAVDTVGDKNSRGKLTKKQQKAADKAKAKRDQDNQLSKLKTTGLDVKPKTLPGVGEIKPIEPNKKKLYVKPPPPPEEAIDEWGNIVPVDKEGFAMTKEDDGSYSQGQGINDPSLANVQMPGVYGGPEAYTPEGFSLYQNTPGSGPQSRTRAKVETVHGRNPSPIKRKPGIQPEYTKNSYRSNPYGNSPFKRIESPFKAKADELSAGDQHVEQLQGQRALSYLGEEGAAAAEGYNAAIEEHNYDQRVWAEKAKDVDDAYGKLSVEPTGVSSWDSAAQNMAMEWKNEFTQLYNNKDSYSYEEYATKLGEIKGRAAEYQNANANIERVVADYAERKDEISASTPSDNIDILETLSKGGDGLTTKNIDGVPTLVGTTLGGKDVSVPISDIASGKNIWRVNTQVDVEPQITKITDQLGKFRTQVAQNGGLTTQQVPFEQIRGRAESQVAGMLQNPQQVRAIAADRFGMSYREMQGQQDDDIRNFVQEKLMGEIEQQFQPYTQVQSGRTVDPVAREQRIAANQARGGASGKGSVSERDYAKQLEAANRSLGKDFDYKSPNSFKNLGYDTFTPDQLSKDQRKQIEQRYGEGAYVVKVGKKSIVVPPDASREWVARNIFGVDPAELSPLNRLSPFKRLTNWMGVTK